MLRNRRLARVIADAGWGEFLRQLQYKADWYGATVWPAHRWYPSTKTCSTCGAVNPALTLNDRAWKCRKCGARHDRDRNAARNLLNAMLATTSCVEAPSPGSSPETQNACRGAVGP